MTKLTTLIYTPPAALGLTAQEKLVMVTLWRIIEESKNNSSSTAQLVKATGLPRSFIEETSAKIWKNCFYLTKHTDRFTS